MHRPARLGPLLIITLFALLAAAVACAAPATAPTSVAAPAASAANLTPHADDNEVTRGPVPATRHLTASTLLGVLAEATPPSMAGLVPGGAPPEHHRPATQQAGPRQGRAPPAITDR